MRTFADIEININSSILNLKSAVPACLARDPSFFFCGAEQGFWIASSTMTVPPYFIFLHFYGTSLNRVGMPICHPITYE